MMNKEQFKEWFDECMDDYEELENDAYTIKLIGNKKQIVKGFYALIINGTTFSNEHNIFQGIDKKQLKALKKTKCPYKILK